LLQKIYKNIKINLQLNTATTHKATADKPVAARGTSSLDQFASLLPSYAAAASFQIAPESFTAFDWDPFHLLVRPPTSIIGASFTAKSFAVHPVHFLPLAYFVPP